MSQIQVNLIDQKQMEKRLERLVFKNCITYNINIESAKEGKMPSEMKYFQKVPGDWKKSVTVKFILW